MLATDPVPAPDLGAVLGFIGGQQADRARGTGLLRAERGSVEPELAALDQPWQRTVRVVRDGDAVVGASLVNWDAEAGRSWVYGPWALGEGEAWAGRAEALLDAALAQVPAPIVDHELSADLANERLVGLAERRGWQAAEPHHVYCLCRDRAEKWPRHKHERVRPATLADVALVQLMHEAEFPATYATARQLITDPDAITLVIENSDHVLGYASGHVGADGAGHIDFMAVHPDARGLGDGHRLLQAVGLAVLDRSRTGQVVLQVAADRQPAIALYEKRGFERVGTTCSFRSVAGA